VVFLDPLAVQVTPESFLRHMDGPILAVWAVSSAVLLVGFVLLVIRTRRMRRAWRRERAGGRRVVFSRDLGPAVVGFLRPEIVLPDWCRDLDARTLDLIIDHEAEHLRAGDLRLTLSMGILPILLPWHAPIWWLYKRLRLAVEGDCDLRVVKDYPERTRPYMELLLEVGGRVPTDPALVAMLSEPEETLERRIRIMTMPFPRKPWMRGLALAGIGALFVAVACWAPSPNDIRPAETRLPAVQPAPPPETRGAPSELVKTPYTVSPEIKNREEILTALESEYPPILRDAGISGTVQVWFFIDETGKLQRFQINESSGHEALDRAAERVASIFQFTPALNGEDPVAVWISLPIAFSVQADQPQSAAAEREGRTGSVEKATPSGLVPPPEEVLPSAVPNRDLSSAPTFTPYTVRPDIKNRRDIAEALEAEYPPVLRDAGVGGTIQVWFFIDETGRVARTQINESSGHQALDDAALRVASVIEFTPARKEEKPVPVWISLPITFSTR
jgi:TonB family protein